MNKLRLYTDLAEMLEKEASATYTDGVRDLVAHYEKDHPDFQYIVLFIEPRDPSVNYYILVHVPSPGLESLEIAERSILADGRHPVAVWIRTDQPSA